MEIWAFHYIEGKSGRGLDKIIFGETEGAKVGSNHLNMDTILNLSFLIYEIAITDNPKRSFTN